MTEYIDPLAKRIKAEHEAGQPKPHAFPTPFRHSDGGDCARFLGLKAMGVPESDPFDEPSMWATWLGTLLHKEWQKACKQSFGNDFEDEVPVQDYYKMASGSLDGLHQKKVTIEMKFVNADKFKSARGVQKRGIHSKYIKASGPDQGHVIQLALNTSASESDFGVLVYVSLTAFSKQVQYGLTEHYPNREPMTDRERWTYQWVYPASQMRDIAAKELDRLETIKWDAAHGILQDPVTADGELLDPLDLSHWQCWYCSRRTACKQHPLKIRKIRRSDG